MYMASKRGRGIGKREKVVGTILSSASGNRVEKGGEGVHKRKMVFLSDVSHLCHGAGKGVSCGETEEHIVVGESKFRDMASWNRKSVKGGGGTGIDFWGGNFFILWWDLE